MKNNILFVRIPCRIQGADGLAVEPTTLYCTNAKVDVLNAKRLQVGLLTFSQVQFSLFRPRAVGTIIVADIFECPLAGASG